MQIDIIIPNLNGKKFLKACLKSLELQSYQDFNLILVDNGSTDDSVNIVKCNFPLAKIISFNKNMGFSYAVNAGIKASSSPFIFLLNNDTELDKYCLEELVKAANYKKECDFFATKMINFNNRDLLDGAGDSYLRGGVGYKLGTMEKDSEFYNNSRHVFGACAGAAMYRRSLFKEIGTFDNNFFAYLEDVDLNFRACSRGKQCWYVSAARVYHIGSATTGSRVNDVTIYLSTRNNLNILLKNYSITLLLFCAPTIIVYQIVWFCFVLKKRRVLAYIKGVFSFLRESPKMLEKRRRNLNLQCVNNRLLFSKISKAELEVVNSIMKRRLENKKGIYLLTLYKRLFLRGFE